MTDWKFANKLRPHNRKETFKHFMVKSMVFKTLFNEGHEVYSEYDVFPNGRFEKGVKYRVADIFVYVYKNRGKDIVVEIETKITKKHQKDLMKFYENYLLYIIELKDISDDIKEMEKQIKHILGM